MRFDLVIIGCGPAGYKAASAAARLGASVAIVERSTPGGTCLNEGCIPSRTLLHAASLIEDVQALAGRGLVGAVEGDFTAAARHRDSVVRGMREGVMSSLRRIGVSCLHGTARLESTRRVRVTPPAGGEDEFVEAERVFIATGSRARQLVEWPCDGRVVVTSHEFFGARHALPGRVLCVGGGAIGVEAAYFARQFGARVTLVEREPRLLPGTQVPEHVADKLECKLAGLGVEVITGVAPPGCRIEAGRARVALKSDVTAEFDLVLVAVGRVPNSGGLGLEAIGVRTDAEGRILTNEYLETDARGVYAIGDVHAGRQTATAAFHDAKVAVGNALGGERVRANYFKVPFVVQSALEIATVGLSEEQADDAGFTPEVARASFGASGKARARHDYDGFVEVVHDVETGQLLGGCIVGPEAGEQILLLAAACQSPRGMWFFKDLNYSHPSWCEEIETAIDPHAVTLARSVETLFQPGIHAAG